MKRALFALAVVATLALVAATVLAVLERRKEDARRRAEEERSATTLERLHRLKELIDARGATCETYPPLAAGDQGDSDGQQALAFAIHEMLASDSAVLADAWGRPIQFRRPGPVHRDGWDIHSLGSDGKGTDRSLYLGEHYVPPPRDARVDELYAKETRERLEALVSKSRSSRGSPSPRS